MTIAELRLCLSVFIRLNSQVYYYRALTGHQADRYLNMIGAFLGNPYFLILSRKVLGGSAYAVDFSETTDRGPGDAGAISVAWAKNVIKGVEVYASFRIESLDNVAGADDITALIGGARVKFL